MLKTQFDNWKKADDFLQSRANEKNNKTRIRKNNRLAFGYNEWQTHIIDKNLLVETNPVIAKCSSNENFQLIYISVLRLIFALQVNWLSKFIKIDSCNGGILHFSSRVLSIFIAQRCLLSKSSGNNIIYLMQIILATL